MGELKKVVCRVPVVFATTFDSSICTLQDDSKDGFELTEELPDHSSCSTFPGIVLARPRPRFL